LSFGSANNIGNGVAESFRFEEAGENKDSSLDTFVAKDALDAVTVAENEHLLFFSHVRAPEKESGDGSKANLENRHRLLLPREQQNIAGSLCGPLIQQCSNVRQKKTQHRGETEKSSQTCVEDCLPHCYWRKDKPLRASVLSGVKKPSMAFEES
jgi:hypothetical protein